MKKTLHDLLAAGKTAEVLSELQRLIPPDTGLHQQVIQLSARFAENERRRHSDTRTDDALGVELNKINEAVLLVIGEMERGESNSKEVTGQTVTYSTSTFSMKNILYFIAAAIASVAIWYTFQWYKADPDNREPLPALLTGVSSLLLLFIAWRLEGNSEKPGRNTTKRHVEQHGDKSVYIEKNEGDITIN